MTSTHTCQTMNGLYQIMKGMTVDELRAAREIIEVEQTGEGRRLLVHCCNETIRRKLSGAWS